MADFTLSYRSFTILFVAKLLFGALLFSLGIAQFTDMGSMLLQKTNPEIFLFRNVCYKDIGCFDNGSPFFHPVDRPISVQPKECEKTTFPLYTPSNRRKPYNFTLNEKSVKNSPYRCDLPTIVISHGFLTDNKAFRKMKNKILSIGDYNVIVPNYPDYAKPLYSEAVANMRTIGAKLGVLIGLLMDYCNDKTASRFHLIGHSLGAHLSGYAAKHLGMKMGRISGLDVAGPFFQGDGLPEETKLSKNDADFVDVIHTNAAETVAAGGFGFYHPVGHMDFWVNDGYSQPGCDPVKSLADMKINFTDLFVSVGCSHSRAHELYDESVTSTDCKFIGEKCDSYLEFQSKTCLGNKKAEMGFHAKKMDDVPPGSVFYLETNAHKPYCMKKDTKSDQTQLSSFLSALGSYFG